MNTFQRSLRALGHPASLAAIGLLLVNDHVLKSAYPSWVTGKLSDFAGLFFFPFLLIAIGALPARGLGEERAGRWLPRVAFAWTAVWFAAIKLWPVANEATTVLVARLVRAPVFIAPDATDVMALVVLVPAWGLWRRVGQPEPIRTAPRLEWKGLAALALAGAASLATSIMPDQKLVRVAAVDGEVYGVLTWEVAYSGDRIGRLVPWPKDEGFNLDTEPLPEVVAAKFGEYITYPYVACDPADPLTCYRIRFIDQLEGSTDGGETWQIAWQVPPARRAYVAHYTSQFAVCCYTAQADGGPYDLAFLEQPEGSTLLVAMGGRGLLRRTPDGQWEALSVDNADPVPYTGASIWIIWREVLASFGAGFAVLLSLSRITASTIVHDSGQRDRIIKLSNWPLPIAIALLFVTGLWWFVRFVGIGPWLVGLGGVAVWGFALADQWITSVRATAVRPEQADKAARYCWLTFVGVVVTPLAVFYAWMLGYIQWYEVAVTLAVVSGAAITYLGGRAALEAARLANEAIRTAAD